MVREAQLKETDAGLAPQSDGWFVVNARDVPWRYTAGRGAYCDFEGDFNFPQLGIALVALEPGEAMAMYHWEEDQEDFLVLSGEAVAIVEDEERPLRQWDLVHCPPKANHVIVGAGDRPCLVLAVGARVLSEGPNWGGYSANEKAARHGASVDTDTSDPDEAYARYAPRESIRVREGWLPE